MGEAKDYGYDYAMSLAQAIEKVTASEEEKNPNAFICDGINFKYALERALYSAYADNSGFFEIFSKWRESTLPKEIKVKNEVEKKLLSKMLEIDGNKIRVEAVLKKKFFVKSFVRFLLQVSGAGRLASFLRNKINSFNKKKKENDLLFFVINERFANYMRPILENLPGKCAYFTHDKKLEKYFEKEKLPHVKISHFLDNITRWSEADSWLKKYGIRECGDILSSAMEHIRPKTVALVEGNAYQYEVINRICQKLNLKCICIQQGWSPTVHNGFRNMTYSKMLVWGKGFAELLRPCNPKENFTVVGNYTINLAEARRPTKIKNVAFFMQAGTNRFTRMLSLDILKKYSEFITWTAENFKDVNVIIREHPVDRLEENERKDFEKFKNIKFMNPETHSLKDVMDLADLSVSIYSSTILESIASGVMPIIFNLTSFPNYFPDVSAEHAGIEVKNLAQAKNVLRELLKNPEKISSFSEGIDKFRHKYLAFGGKEALNNVKRELVL